MTNDNLNNKYIEFINLKTIKEIQKLSEKLKITRENIRKTNIDNKSTLLIDVDNNLKKLTDAYVAFFNAFFNEHEIESMRDIYIENSKNHANETIKEISKKLNNLSYFCVDESKRFLNETNVDIASNYLDTALLLDINNAAAYYYLCLIALTKNKLVDALMNIKKAISLGFNKGFCLHYLKIIKEKIKIN